MIPRIGLFPDLGGRVKPREDLTVPDAPLRPFVGPVQRHSLAVSLPETAEDRPLLSDVDREAGRGERKEAHRLFSRDRIPARSDRLHTVISGLFYGQRGTAVGQISAQTGEGDFDLGLKAVGRKIVRTFHARCRLPPRECKDGCRLAECFSPRLPYGGLHLAPIDGEPIIAPLFLRLLGGKHLKSVCRSRFLIPCGQVGAGGDRRRHQSLRMISAQIPIRKPPDEKVCGRKVCFPVSDPFGKNGGPFRFDGLLGTGKAYGRQKEEENRKDRKKSKKRTHKILANLLTN